MSPRVKVEYSTLDSLGLAAKTFWLGRSIRQVELRIAVSQRGETLLPDPRWMMKLEVWTVSELISGIR